MVSMLSYTSSSVFRENPSKICSRRLILWDRSGRTESSFSFFMYYRVAISQSSIIKERFRLFLLSSIWIFCVLVSNACHAIYRFIVSQGTGRSPFLFHHYGAQISGWSEIGSTKLFAREISSKEEIV